MRQQNLSLAKIKNIDIPLPNALVQKQIVEQLNNDFIPKVGDDTAVFADMTFLANDFETDPKTGNKTVKMDRVSVRFRETEDKEIFIETADIELLEKKKDND